MTCHKVRPNKRQALPRCKDKFPLAPKLDKQIVRFPPQGISNGGNGFTGLRLAALAGNGLAHPIHLGLCQVCNILLCHATVEHKQDK